MNYMAPEQVRAEAVDHRADVFSVGVLLYELLSGHKAFEADSFAATMYKVLQERPAPLESLGGHALPAELLDDRGPRDRKGSRAAVPEHGRHAARPASWFGPRCRRRLRSACGDATDAAPRASSARASGRPLPEPETTLDAPRVPVPGRTPPPSRHAGRSSTEARGPRHPCAGRTSSLEPPRLGRERLPQLRRLPRRRLADTSQLLAIVSAAALVVIAIAVIAFVVRGRGDRTPPAGDDAPPRRDGAAERAGWPGCAAPAGRLRRRRRPRPRPP